MRARRWTTVRHTLLLAVAIAIASGAAGRAQQRDRPDVPAGTGFLLGQVVEADGHTPVAGALVQVTVTVNPNNLAQERFTVPGPLTARSSRTVATNGGGFFLFLGLGKGLYSINVTAPGHLAGGYAQVKPGGAMRPIELGDNEPRTGVVITVWKYGSITGTVVDDAGEPAVGALVTVLSRAGGPSLSPRSSVFTDDRGVYRFGTLAPGVYAVGLVTATTTLPVTEADTIESAAANPNVSFGLTARMFAEGALSPPMTGSGIRVGDVVIQRIGDAGGGLPPPDEQGRMMTCATSFYPGTAVLRDAAPIVLAPGENRTGIDLTMKLVPAVRVSGVATGPKGAMKGLVVHLASAANGPLSALEPIGGANAFTNEKGAFEFFGIAPGQYVIWAGRTPINPGDENQDDWSSASEALTVGAADLRDVALTLRPGVKVSGRFEFVGSKPRPEGRAAGAVILRPVVETDFLRTGRALVAPDGTFSTPGDLSGRYVIGVTAPPGWFVASVTHDGRNITEEPVDVGPADMTDVVVTLTDKSTHVRGGISDPNGAPDTQADVIAFPADSNSWRDVMLSTRRVRLTTASLAGSYLFDDLPPGEYFLVAVDTRTTANWRDPDFLARLATSAVRVTLGRGDDKTVALRRSVPRDK